VNIQSAVAINRVKADFTDVAMTLNNLEISFRSKETDWKIVNILGWQESHVVFFQYFQR